MRYRICLLAKPLSLNHGRRNDFSRPGLVVSRATRGIIHGRFNAVRYESRQLAFIPKVDESRGILVFPSSAFTKLTSITS